MNNIMDNNTNDKNIINDNIITFIIPTIGRETLKNTLISLQNQNIENWKAIIIFDGCNQNINNIDDRIKIVRCNKVGSNINNAGLVRNYGIEIADTKWVAFLDDDDIIDESYLEKFYEELELNNEFDVLIFRLNHSGRVIPNLNTDNFYINDVGISFVAKKEIFDREIKFVPDSAEDFLLLNQIRKKNYKIIISPYVMYYVENSVHDSNIIGNRVKINYNNNVHTLFDYLLLNYYSNNIE
jgi:glycosyltransferase involved in cell wall biosynthesis